MAMPGWPGSISCVRSSRQNIRRRPPDITPNITRRVGPAKLSTQSWVHRLEDVSSSPVRVFLQFCIDVVVSVLHATCGRADVQKPPCGGFCAQPLTRSCRVGQTGTLTIFKHEPTARSTSRAFPNNDLAILNITRGEVLIPRRFPLGIAAVRYEARRGPARLLT